MAKRINYTWTQDDTTNEYTLTINCKVGMKTPCFMDEETADEFRKVAFEHADFLLIQDESKKVNVNEDGTYKTEADEIQQELVDELDRALGYPKTRSDSDYFLLAKMFIFGLGWNKPETFPEWFADIADSSADLQRAWLHADTPDQATFVQEQVKALQMDMEKCFRNVLTACNLEFDRFRMSTWSVKQFMASQFKTRQSSEGKKNIKTAVANLKRIDTATSFSLYCAAVLQNLGYGTFTKETTKTNWTISDR